MSVHRRAAATDERGAADPGLLAAKLLLSISVGIALAYPFFIPGQTGVLRELEGLGPMGTFLVVACFLGLVYRYARDLRTTLALVSPDVRTAHPRRVWLMFAIPYNFIEDFFIIGDVARSLRAQATTHPRLAKLGSFGAASGFGWCTAQIVSLVPNQLGAAAGLVAIVLWLWHWIFIRRAIGALSVDM